MAASRFWSRKFLGFCQTERKIENAVSDVHPAQANSRVQWGIVQFPLQTRQNPLQSVRSCHQFCGKFALYPMSPPQHSLAHSFTVWPKIIVSGTQIRLDRALIPQFRILDQVLVLSRLMPPRSCYCHLAHVGSHIHVKTCTNMSNPPVDQL